ncbi:protein MMS22-like [Caerostris darwini]|uniref:Protein MMS22-like n=1 Tax=Caerostris darwini TaxID=1538125 RepID=A0AAV4UV95_9ARAC|nr:protein MMS22-like [Caerostris darwini]
MNLARKVRKLFHEKGINMDDLSFNSNDYLIESIPSFSCKAQSSNTYLKSQQFSRCLNLQLQVSSDLTVLFFNRSFSSSSVLYNDIHFLFGEMKKYFFLIRNITMDKTNLFLTAYPLSEVQEYRQQINKVLQFILNNLQVINSNYYCTDEIHLHSLQDSSSDSKMISNVMKEIKNLLVFIGRISSLPNITRIIDFKEDNHIAEYCYHYIHLHLDLWWNCATILFTINKSLTDKFESLCNDVNQLDQFLQIITLIIIDLISIAIKRYQNINSFGNSPFMCKCFKDIWIMLIKILDSKSVDGKYSFWTIYHNAIQNIQKQTRTEKTDFDIPIDSFSLISEPMDYLHIVEPCLWLTSYIAPLYKYDVCGNYYEQEMLKSGYSVIKCLINSLLIDNSDRKEKLLRPALFYILQLITIWEPSCEVLLPLTDFYIKKINETFIIPGNDVKDLGYLFSDSLSWFEYIDNLSNTQTTLENENSFYLFLHILYIQLNKDASEGTLWRSLKGRIYSKFVSKKFVELSEVGLQNSFSLILAVAKSGQLEVSDKICDLASLMKTSNYKKKVISWKALFVLMFIHQKMDNNFNKIVKKVVEFFNLTCYEYSSTKDSMHKFNLMNLLFVYIDSMNELFQRCDDFKSSQFQLLTSGFSILLSSSGISELNRILRVLLNILKKVQSIVEDRNDLEMEIIGVNYQEFLELTFKYVFPFIEQMSTSNTPPLILSEIAAVLTVLSYKCIFSLNDTKIYNFSSIFLHFGCKDVVNNSIICHYLCLILNDESLQTRLKEKITDFSSLIFNSWLRCILELHPNCGEMHYLSEKVLLKNDIVEIFPRMQNLNFRENNHNNIAIEVFRIMGQTFDESSDLKHKHQLKQKAHSCFQKYVSCVSNLIKKQHDGLLLNQMYKLTSYLVYYCSPLLHMTYNPDSILPQLFDRIVAPHHIFPKDKQAQSTVSHAIKEYLPNFIRGIFKLDYRKEKVAEKALKEVLLNYVCIHPSSNNSISKLCIDSVQNKEEGLKWDELQFLLDVMNNSVLNSNTNPMNGFELIFEIFKAAPLSRTAVIANILLKSTFEIYMKQGSTLSQYLRNLMCKVFLYFKNSMDVKSSKNILIPILQWFIQEKIPWSSARGFSVLDCVSDYLPHVMSDIIPFLSKTIEELENNRGFGEDVVLRNHLKNIITKLQEKLRIKH